MTSPVPLMVCFIRRFQSLLRAVAPTCIAPDRVWLPFSCLAGVEDSVSEQSFSWGSSLLQKAGNLAVAASLLLSPAAYAEDGGTLLRYVLTVSADPGREGQYSQLLGERRLGQPSAHACIAGCCVTWCWCRLLPLQAASLEHPRGVQGAADDV
jgi:hypothetical protein